MITPPGQSFDLHLPAGTARLFDQRIAAIPEPRATPGATIASPPAIRWPRWRASITSRSRSWPAPINCDPAPALRASRRSWFRLLPRPTPSSRMRALHRAQGRYAGHHRRPFRRLAQPVAPLEQDHRHQGGAGPPPACGRARRRSKGRALASPRLCGCNHTENRARKGRGAQARIIGAKKIRRASRCRQACASLALGRRNSKERAARCKEKIVRPAFGAARIPPRNNENFLGTSLNTCVLHALACKLLIRMLPRTQCLFAAA